ncbi:GNAT family N-acetyltransferase [Streptomyces alanosinicus]|uniref:GNAT family N-acetyltransferase n=1 Tax=Streptomyces alanosinicus TaxID=68171 RepID=UPI001671D637|nr:GNAT family N-acetyltransferase [Streptomyces alanosinicus]
MTTAADRLHEPDVVRLTEWRNRFVQVFLTEFEATAERTADWLREVIGPDDSKIIFMLDDADGRTVGYMGLAQIDWESGRFEVDGIVRGAPQAKGGISAGLRTLMSWALGQLGLAEARVRVRSDNPRAVDFYRRIGFVEDFRRPLVRTVEPGMVRWTEQDDAPAGAPTLIHMTWVPNAR